ncbi:MAG: nitroreductase family protein [Desulfosarcina sp.]|nr:nitroreductase family protein [Desulfobacterales bacterium]
MFADLIRNRRSMRQFLEQPIEQDKINALVEAALRAPSSRSLNPWEFILVDNRDQLTALAAAKPHGAAFLANAPLGIVVCADPQRCDVWVEDCSIAVIFVQLMAESLGLGSCWIQIRKRSHASGRPARDHIADLLHIPAHLSVEAMIAIGYPARQKTPHPFSALPFEKIHYSDYGRPYKKN